MDSGEVMVLGLYFVQQLGVMLGVGAALLSLIAYVAANRDGVVEPAEARLARIIERVIMVGLLCMIISGVVITLLHSIAGEIGTIFTPAYIFKWILIGVVALPLIVGHKHPFPPQWFEGFIGATWFALFMLHVVAPLTSWFDLMVVYGIWIVVFLLVWVGVDRTFMNIPKPAVKKSAPAPAPAVVKPTAPVPASKSFSLPKLPNFAPLVKPLLASMPALPKKPVAPVVVEKTPTKPVAAAPHKPAELPPAHLAVPMAPVPAKPALVPTKPPVKPEEKAAEDPDQYPALPAVRVMPRTPEDLPSEHRATVVQFS